MARKSLTERSCIFFLVPLLICCAVVAGVAVQVVHFVMHRVSFDSVGEFWYAYLAVAVVVAGAFAIARRLVRRGEDRQSSAPAEQRAAASNASAAVRLRY